MDSQNSMDLLILKLMIAREILRIGAIDAKELPNLITKVAQYIGGGRPITTGNIIYLLDILSISGDKVTLSEDGMQYLRILEILANNIPKIP